MHINRRLLILTCLSFLLSSMLWADGRFRDIIIGNRPAGFAGAFIGVADDNNAAWYNPAGMTQISDSMVGTSPSLEYSYRIQKESFLYKDEESSSLLFVPTALSSVSTVGKGKLGLGIFMTEKSAFTQNTETGIVTLGVDDWTGYVDRAINTETFYMGASYAYPVKDNLSLGFGGFFVSSAYNENAYLFIADPLQPVDEYLEANGKQTAEKQGICLQGSLMWKPSETFSLGISLRSRTLLKGDHLVRESVTAVVPDGADPVFPQNDVLLHSVTIDSDAEPQVIPGSIGAGIGWRINDKWFLAFDLIRNFNAVYKISDSLDAEIQAITDFSLGFEYRIREHIPLRFGFFSNYSYYPDVNSSPDPQLPHVDMFGAVIGIGVEKDQKHFFISIKLSSGSGKNKVYNLDTSVYEPVEMHISNRSITMGMAYSF